MAIEGDMLLYRHFLLFCFFFATTECQVSGPIVDTQYGQVLGNSKTYNGSAYEEFLGIPFGAPPLGILRWEKPQPITPWAPEVWNATEFSIPCTQTGVPESGEDCLFLNIWVPNGVSANNGSNLPVMVWIYGGGFLSGSGSYYPAYELALHGDMIIVNFNYRLNTIGWISTADSVLPGNYGLWDVQAGLQWVQDNIRSFNGDPDQVTIFGQSAGGSTVSHTVISPQTNTLFKNAIAISGSSTGIFGIQYTPLQLAIQLSYVFNCSANNTQDIEDCLREVGAHTLCFWGLVVNPTQDQKLPSAIPVVDGEFVVRHPVQSFELGEGKDVNFMTGSCFHDPGSMVMLLTDDGYINLAATNESLLLTLKVLYGFLDNPEEIMQMIFQVYPDMNTPDNETRTFETVKAAAEGYFGGPSNWEAVRHSEAQGLGKTFQYQFRHRQSWVDRFPAWVNGTHSDDLYSIFGPSFRDVEYSDVDLAISKRIMDYFTNFAHTGDPNQGPYTVQEWTEFNSLDQNYLQESPTFLMNTFYEDNIVDRYRFWADVPNHYIFPPPPTFPGESLSEEEIDEAVRLFKENLFQTIDDEETRMEWEKIIDGFVEDRRLGFPINS